MKKTIICHFYNEEYLLPWWLKHHKNIFDHGIMINYNSTDKSVELIREICPSWEIVDSRNQLFSAEDIDREVQDYEKTVDGYKIALNVTEFLVGNFSKLEILNKELYIPMASMVDENSNFTPDQNEPLTSQCFFGINPQKYFESGSRLLHFNKSINYPTGRHFWNIKNTEDFLILRYKHSPWNEKFIKRKMQIANKQSLEDLKRGWGFHHQFNLEQLNEERVTYLKKSENLLSILNNFEYWRY